MSNSNTARRKMKKRVRDILGNARPVQFFPVTGAVDFLPKDDGDRRFWPLPGAQAEVMGNKLKVSGKLEVYFRDDAALAAIADHDRRMSELLTATGETIIDFRRPFRGGKTLHQLAAPNFHKQALAADRMAKQMDAAMLAAGHARGVHDEWVMSTCATTPPTEPLTIEKLEALLDRLGQTQEPSLFAMSRSMLDTVLPIVEPREWVIQSYHGLMLKPVHEIEAAWRRDMLANGFVEVEPGEWFNEAQDVRIWRDEAPIGSVGGVRSEITD